jgi:ribulose bisphosphate carboxylase small subunit
MVIDYSRTAGTENNMSSALTFYESISKQLSTANLKGLEVVKREKTKDGTWWTLWRMSKNDAAEAAVSAMQDVIENEASRYAEFKAMDALKLMESQLNK